MSDTANQPAPETNNGEGQTEKKEENKTAAKTDEVPLEAGNGPIDVHDPGTRLDKNAPFHASVKPDEQPEGDVFASSPKAEKTGEIDLRASQLDGDFSSIPNTQTETPGEDLPELLPIPRTTTIEKVVSLEPIVGPVPQGTNAAEAGHSATPAEGLVALSSEGAPVTDEPKLPPVPGSRMSVAMLTDEMAKDEQDPTSNIVPMRAVAGALIWDDASLMRGKEEDVDRQIEKTRIMQKRGALMEQRLQIIKQRREVYAKYLELKQRVETESTSYRQKKNEMQAELAALTKQKNEAGTAQSMIAESVAEHTQVLHDMTQSRPGEAFEQAVKRSEVTLGEIVSAMRTKFEEHQKLDTRVKTYNESVRTKLTKHKEEIDALKKAVDLNERIIREELDPKIAEFDTQLAALDPPKAA